MNKPMLALGLTLWAFGVFLLWSVAAVAQVCTGDDALYIAGDYVIAPGEILETDRSVVVCPGGSLTATTGGISFSTDGRFSGEMTDVGLYVYGTINIEAPEVTSWLSTVPKGTFEPFQYGVTRSPTISSGSARLASEPVGWQVGDTLLLTTERGDTERVELQSINGAAITFDSQLIAYALRYNGRTVLPKIANLSRRFVIESDNGAHTMYMAGSSVRISGVEFRNLGARRVLGRYPVHFHQTGQSDAVVRGSSIWSEEPSNRWVTIHSTQGVTVADNVMYNSMGHGVFLEAGDEYDNTIIGNLTAKLEHVHGTKLPDGKTFFGEIPNKDVQIFTGTSEAPVHLWLRQGNTVEGNVSVGYTDDWAYNHFGHSHGMAILPSTKKVDTIVRDYECMGCGAFGIWTFIGSESVTVDDSALIYNRTAGWYPVLDNTLLSNSLLALNSWDTNWKGQAFFNTKGGFAEVRDTDMAGCFGIDLHYVGHVDIYGGIVESGDSPNCYLIKANYWENTMRLRGVELLGKTLFANVSWGDHKRSAPVPIWLQDGTTLNGETLEGMFVKHPGHSRYFKTYGDVFNVGIRAVEEPGYWIPTPSIPGQGFYGVSYFRTIRKAGDPEPSTKSWAAEYESGYNRSVEAGNLGYPHGFPAGTYLVKYYNMRGEYIGREDTFTVGDAPTPNRPPSATIVTTQNVYPDTDNLPGETVTLSATTSDPDGDMLVTEWMINGALISTSVTAEAALPDGVSTITFRATDPDGLQAEAFLDITVTEPPPPPEVDWEQRYKDLIDSLIEVLESAR